MGSPTRLGGGVVNLYTGTVTTAGTVFSGTATGYGGASVVGLQTKFAYGSGGTSCKAYIQTSFDQATTWVDIASFAFTTSSATRLFSVSVSGTAQVTPTTNTLTDNTQVPGLLGDRFRVAVVSTGTYAGTTTVTVDASFKAV